MTSPDQQHPEYAVKTDLATVTGPALAQATVQVGVDKAGRAAWPTFVLAVLAGMFIGLGALGYTLVQAGGLNFAAGHILGGLIFCVGLVLVLVAGADLFTGYILIALAWMRGRVTAGEMLRNWGLALLGNLVGGVLLAALVRASGHTGLDSGKVADAAVSIAQLKVARTLPEAFTSGILCNLLVCLAVWMGYAGHTVTDKVMAVLFPITLFVAAGFEHSIANMYFLPLGMMLAPQTITLGGVLGNLIPVILGNVVGGVVFVALAYHWAYPAKKG